jgi:hypothetical protein
MAFGAVIIGDEILVESARTSISPSSSVPSRVAACASPGRNISATIPSA